MPVSLLTNFVFLTIALISLRRSRQRSNVMQAKQKDENSKREVIIFFKASENYGINVFKIILLCDSTYRKVPVVGKINFEILESSVRI